MVYPDFLTIGYEKDGLTVAQDDTVTFTIDSVIPSRIYHVEIIVDDKFIFPSRADESKFTVDKSSLGIETNIIEIVGVDQIVNKVLDKVDTNISQVITDITDTNDAIKQAEEERKQWFEESGPKIEQSITKSEEALTTSQRALDLSEDMRLKLGLVVIKNLSDGFESGTINNRTGSVASSDSISVTSDFIEVNPTAKYVYGSRVFEGKNTVSMKVARYDRDKAYLSTTDWVDVPQDTPSELPLTEDTKYVKVAVSNYGTDGFFLNLGDVPYYRLPPGTTYGDGFWDDTPNTSLEEKSVKPIHLSDETTEIISEWQKLTKVYPVGNLFTEYISGTLKNSDGNFTQSSDHVVSSDYIPVDSSEDYTIGLSEVLVSNRTLYKVAFYDRDKKFIQITNWIVLWDYPNYYTELAIPGNASFIKCVVNKEHKDVLFVNEGNTPFYESKKTTSGFSELIPSGVISEDKFTDSIRKKLNNAEQEQPFPKKPFWEVVDIGSTKISHLSKNGRVIYASQSNRVVQSLDEGETWQEVCRTPNSMMVRAIRDSDDGEILFSSNRYASGGIKAKVYKTKNYNVDDLSGIEVVEVLEADNINADFNDDWGLDVQHNIAVAIEYGRQGDDGASCAYLSTDFGSTFKKIFDQKTTPAGIDGGPVWTKDAHTHTIHYDRYWGRIWIVAGDQDNSAAYYSDDLGETWGVIKGSVGKDSVQYTGITSYPEAVFFGSDRPVDGIYVYRRSQGKYDGTIELLYNTERVKDIRAVVYNRAFRRFGDKDEVTYFTAARDIAVDGELGSIVVSFRGTKGHQVIFDATEDLPDYMSEITSCVGDTAKGNVLFSVKNTSTVSYTHLTLPTICSV